MRAGQPGPAQDDNKDPRKGGWERLAEKVGLQPQELSALKAVGSAIAVLSGIAQLVGPFTRSGIAQFVVAAVFDVGGTAVVAVVIVVINRHGNSIAGLGARLARAAVIMMVIGAVGGLLGFGIGRLDFAPQAQVRLTMTCQVPPDLSPGQQTTVTYEIYASAPVTVGFGAGLYDAHSSNHATGVGDLDSVSLRAGRQTVSRPLTIPSALASGQYELAGEVWPADQIDADGASTLAQRACGYVHVP